MIDSESKLDQTTKSTTIEQQEMLFPSEQELEEIIRALQEEASNFKSLLKHPGWTQLKVYVEQQIETRKRMALDHRVGLNDLGDVFRQEYAKGEMAGIELFAAFPEARLSDVEDQLTPLFEELENERWDSGGDDNERERRNGAGDDSGDFEFGAP